MSKYVFRLLHGRHAMGSVRNPKTGKKDQSKVYNKGDLIYTDTNLHEVFGPSAPSKFELCNQAPSVPAEPKPEPEEVDDVLPADEVEYDVEDDTDVQDAEDETEDDDGLMELNIKQLKAYAEQESIDLGHAKKKADIVEAIRDELTVREE